MHWNYRIVKKKPLPDDSPAKSLEEDCYELREVYYNESGQAWSLTVNAPVPYGETQEELINTLAMMLQDAIECSGDAIDEERFEGAEPDFEIPDEGCDFVNVTGIHVDEDQMLLL